MGLALAGCGEPPTPAPSTARRGAPGVRITMGGLHRAGGVPPGWSLTPPPGDAAAGRRLYRDLGCDACHKVRETEFAGGSGPELTGMGSHHPPAYFVEAIVNPDAVLVEGEPSWIGSDGRSSMPSYPDLTVTQLADLVAYLVSLVDPEEPMFGHAHAGPPSDVPAPPEQEARSFLVSSYDIRPGMLGDFEAWFRATGGPGFRAHPDLVAIETWVDRRRPSAPVTTVFAFRDQPGLARFLDDPATQALGKAFDGFIGAHPHDVTGAPPVYRVPALSAP
jgi:hypothetical protein